MSEEKRSQSHGGGIDAVSGLGSKVTTDAQEVNFWKHFFDSWTEMSIHVSGKWDLHHIMIIQLLYAKRNNTAGNIVANATKT